MEQVKHVAASEIQGLTVIGAGGDVIGEAAMVCIDTQSWHVQSVRVKLRKEVADQMGAERSLFKAGSLEIPVSMIQSVGDTVLLSVPVGSLHQLLQPRGDEHPDISAETAVRDKGR